MAAQPCSAAGHLGLSLTCASWPRHPPGLRLPMLDCALRYRVGETEYAGAWLVRHGLALPPLRGEDGLVLEIKAL